MPKQILRQCVITKKILPKSALWRIVRTASDEIVLEKTKAVAGRGMYVVRDSAAIATLFSEKKAGLWKHALKKDLSPAEKNRMYEEIQEITKKCF